MAENKKVPGAKIGNPNFKTAYGGKVSFFPGASLRPETSADPTILDPTSFQEYLDFLTSNRTNTSLRFGRITQRLNESEAFAKSWSFNHRLLLSELAQSISYRIRNPKHAAFEVLGAYLFDQARTQDRVDLYELAVASFDHAPSRTYLGNHYLQQASNNTHDLNQAIHYLEQAVTHRNFDALARLSFLKLELGHTDIDYVEEEAMRHGFQGLLLLTRTYERMAGMSFDHDKRKFFSTKFLQSAFEAVYHAESLEQNSPQVTTNVPSSVAMESELEFKAGELTKRGLLTPAEIDAIKRQALENAYEKRLNLEVPTLSF